MDKKELILLAEELLKEENLENRKEDLLFLKREYKRILYREEDSYYEQQLNDKFIALFEALAKRESTLMVSTYQEKKNILANMRKLLEVSNMQQASKEMDKLSNDFKNAGRCLKEQDDELWAEYKEIREEFYTKRKAYFEELDKSNAEKRSKKEDIIARAKEVVEHIESVKEATDKMNALMKEWKSVGYSGRGDDGLWKEYSKVLDEFQEKKKEHRQEMVKLFEERAKQKEDLIKKMKILLANSEFTEEEVKKVKDLRNEFNKVGFAGKEKDDALYQEFNKVVQKYFDEKKFYTI
jgi:hypothetical protein